MATKTRNTYEFSDAMLPREDRPHYCHIVARSESASLDFYVSKDLDGRWIYDESTGAYRQELGTLQYRLPSSASSIRRKLRKELERLESEEF